MRKRTARRKVARRAKTRRGGAVGNNNDPSYNVWSRMYGGPAPNVSSRMYGGPAPIVNSNQQVEAPNVPNANPAPNVERPVVPIVNNVRVNRNNAVPVVNDRARQEEARELAEIHAKLAESYSSQMSSSSSMQDIERKFIKQIRDAGEVILYLGRGAWMERIPNLAAQYIDRFYTIEYIITDHNVYSLRYNRKTTGLDFNGQVISGLLTIPIYTFNEPLNLKQTKMLSLLLGFNYSYYPSTFPKNPHSVIENAFNINLEEKDLKMYDARKKFESIIRLIPGSYQNKDWKQLDGLFGLYYNEKTMEFM